MEEWTGGDTLSVEDRSERPAHLKGKLGYPGNEWRKPFQLYHFSLYSISKVDVQDLSGNSAYPVN